MDTRIRRIDGRVLEACSVKKMLGELNAPVIFYNTISEWPAAAWSLDNFTKLFGQYLTKFRLHRRPSAEREPKIKKTSNNIVMETDCEFAEATFQHFYNWINSEQCHDDSDVGALSKYPYAKYWCYADYKYMAEIFKDCPHALKAVDWSRFGFPGRNGIDSTIWISSDGADTPCHQDTYGTNLVAQVHGTKRWILFPPSESVHLKATRIPYEESSVFSLADMNCVECTAKRFEVNLRAGEVLFVPKHWWHHVQSLTPSISINTWLPDEQDSMERVKESLVNFLLYSVKSTEQEPKEKWLNPTQSLPPSFDFCLELVRKAAKERLNDTIGDKVVLNDSFVDTNLIVNCFADNEVLEKVADVLMEKIECMKI